MEWTAQKIAEKDFLPSKAGAVADNIGKGNIGVREGIRDSLLYKNINDREQKVLDGLFNQVGANLAEKFGEKDVNFSYDTKLTFPAELALGKVYEKARAELPNNYSVTDRILKRPVSDRIINPLPDKKHQRREREKLEEEYGDTLLEVTKTENLTDLVTGLLVEGDMRDAIHDEEYEDFQTEPDLPGEEVAEIAQETLFEELQPQLDQYNKSVREAYEQAVDLSMGHQEEDEGFRELFQAAEASPEDAESVIKPYVDAETESRFSLDWSDFDLPYFATQYERVGVLYDGMFDMYEKAGIQIDNDFKRGIMLSTIGAQIWLDDVDDLPEDWQNQQLTPVTAEVLSSDTEQEAYERITRLKDRYLDAAREYADRSESRLAGIGIEYIDRKGQSIDLEKEIRELKDP